MYPILLFQPQIQCMSVDNSVPKLLKKINLTNQFLLKGGQKAYFLLYIVAFVIIVVLPFNVSIGGYIKRLNHLQNGFIMSP